MKTLERRLTEALRSEAEGLPDEVAAHILSPATKRPGFIRLGLAAPAAVVAVLILAAPLIWLVSERGGGELTPAIPQPTTAETSQPATTTPGIGPGITGLLGSVIAQLPEGFDPGQAIPLVTQEGTPEEIASGYLEIRIPTVEAGVVRVEEQDGFTLVQWAWGRLFDPSYRGGDDGFQGWLVLRPIPRGFEVVAATTDGVDLSDVGLSDGAVRGVIESNSGEFIGADVLNLDGSPVDSAPFPDGSIPDAATLWGTAGAGNPPLTLDIPISEPVIIRVNQVGGTLLSISEVILGQANNDSVGAVAEELDEELVDESEEVLAWGNAGESTWVLVGWHLRVTGKPTMACTGVRPVIDEDWCTIPDGELVSLQAFEVGDGGVVVIRTQPGVSQVQIESELGSQVLEVYGEADGYPPTAVLATAGTPIEGWMTPLGESGEELSEPIPFSFTEYIKTPAGG